MVRRAGRDRIGLAAGRLDGVERLAPAVPDPDVETRSVQPDVAAHDATELDVADDLVARVVRVDPVLLHGDDTEAEMARHAGDGSGVVGLDATDRDERVAALSDRLRGKVLQLADL